MTILPLLLAAVTVLPSDRMAMADRLFDRGAYAEAKLEYQALRGVAGIAGDELQYRLAEIARLSGNPAEARQLYDEMLKAYPASRHAERARLMRALAGTPEQQKHELTALEGNDVSLEVRVSALYHLGILTSDADRLDRCAKLDPKGRYAEAARFRRAAILAESTDSAVRWSAVGIFNEISFSSDKTRAREALYMAVRCSYSDRRFAEAGPLAKRYLKLHPDGAYATNVRIMAAWSFYLTGKWAEAESFCGDLKGDDFAYLRGACALAGGDSVRAKALLETYLQEYPQGRYRASAELPLARLDFSAAEKGGDKSLLVESARRSALLSKASGDRLRLAWALENAGRADEASGEYTAIARDFPKTADAAEALFRKAMIDARAAHWSETELALAEALSIGTLSPERRSSAAYWRGIAAHRLGHEKEGLVFLKEALAGNLSLDESREARLLIADEAFTSGREAESKAAYAQLAREGACVRMNAARIRNVGRFLLSTQGGAPLPAEAVLCGKALVEAGDSPDWRQAGYILKGAAEEAEGSYTAAIASYRLARKEPVATATEDLPAALLALGLLESKAGEHGEADATLREAILLLANDNARRVQAYLGLARNAAAQGQAEDARKYATIVTTLFDDAAAAAEAKRYLTSEAEEAK